MKICTNNNVHIIIWYSVTTTVAFIRNRKITFEASVVLSVAMLFTAIDSLSLALSSVAMDTDSSGNIETQIILITCV